MLLLCNGANLLLFFVILCCLRKYFRRFIFGIFYLSDLLSEFIRFSDKYLFNCNLQKCNSCGSERKPYICNMTINVI